MAVTTFSPLLGLALPTTGDLDGTWGATVNDSITQLLDSAVAGTTTLAADADVTLSTTNGAANQARNAVLLWTASNGATTRNITAPAQSKAYVVINSGTGSVVLRGAGPTTGVTVVSGEKCLAAWNGSDFVKVASTALSGLTGTLPVANGGTNATTESGARTSLGATTLGGNLFTIANPSAITFPRFNADNTVSSLDAAAFRTAIGAGAGGGTVTSVGGTGTVNGITLTGTVTTSGNLTLGGTLSGVSLTTQVSGTLPVANGGTGQTTYTDGQLLIGNTTGNTLNKATLTAGSGVTITNGAGTITIAATGGGGTGTVTSVAVSGGTTGLTTSGGPITTSGTITLAGTLAIANGGTGQTTRQAALDALAGSVTSGRYLRGNGTDVVMSAIQAADVPTLNQDTTGNAANVTGTVSISNGGTSATNAANALTNLGAYPATNPNGYITTPFPSGTVLLFSQTSAPTGWTKITTHDNKALRVVSGTVGSGGTVAFTTAFASQGVSGTVGNTTLTTSTIPAHSHTYHVSYLLGGGTLGATGNNLAGATDNVTSGTFTAIPSQSTDTAGTGGAHNHTFTGTAINLAVQYVDVILASKN